MIIWTARGPRLSEYDTDSRRWSRQEWAWRWAGRIVVVVAVAGLVWVLCGGLR